MENKKKKRSGLKERDKQIVVAVILVVLLIVSWKFATSFMAEKLQTADKKIAQKTEKRDVLVDANNRRDQIEKDCKTMQDDNEKILGQYPEHTSVEKVIEHICNLFKQYTFGIGQMSYAEEGVFYTFVDKKGAEDTSAGTINVTKVTLDYVTTFPVLIKIVDYINDECGTRVKIEKIDIGTDETTGGLKGQMTLSIYTGSAVAPYVQPDFDVDLGNKLIFK